MVITIALVLVTLGIASVALAATPETNKSRTTVKANAERAGLSDVGRFKFYKGHWWYWLPSNHWAVYENRRWLAPPDENLASGVMPASSSSAITSAETPVTDTGPESGSLADDYPAAPEGPDAARQSAQYHLAVGNTYTRHADEHSRILQQYSALGKNVPAGVVKEHASAIRHDVQQAQKAFSRLAKADKDNPGIADAVEKIQQGLLKATESVKQLEVHVQHQDAVQARLVRGQTAEISALLNDSYSAAREADRKFYDMHSDDYYTSGEGHFVD